MAITPAAMQAALSTDVRGPRVIRCDETQGADATKQEWLVDGGAEYPGRVRWISTTAADNAATQAAAVRAALLA